MDLSRCKVTEIERKNKESYFIYHIDDYPVALEVHCDVFAYDVIVRFEDLGEIDKGFILADLEKALNRDEA